MKKLCILLLFLVSLGLVAQDKIINNFKWLSRPLHGNVKTVNGIIKCDLVSADGKSSKGGLWQTGILKDEISLKEYKYISFFARSTDEKKHLIYFYLRRRLALGNEASYYSIIEVLPEWKNYYLPLISSSNAAIAFRFTKGSKNCDIELSKGGKLLSLQFVSKKPAGLEFKDIRLCNYKNNEKPEMKKIVEQIKTHPRFIPYRFKRIVKPEAVDIFGFQIVIRKDAEFPEKFAADELSRYLKQAAGSDFPVVTVPSCAKTIRLEVKPGKPEEAFFTRLLNGRDLTITANSQRALVFAVYDFLEKAAGIRWFAPFEYGEVVPHNPKLKLPLFEDSSEPLMTYRCPHYCSNRHTSGLQRHVWEMADWAFKNRFNVELERLIDRSEIQKFYALRGSCIWLLEHAGHDFHKWIPPEKYFKSNPEFFCYDRATKKWRAKRAQLCTTNPKLIAELGRIADAYFKRNPEHKNFPLFQEDGSRLWCQCQACLALNPSGSNLGSATENNINLANSVCAEIRKKHPDKGVITYAYNITANAPKKILPQPGVTIMYCYYSDGFPRQMPWESKNSQNILEWSKLVKGKMIIYSYHYLDPRYIFSDGNALINMFRFFNVMGVQGSNQESCESWGGIDGYLLYLGARAAWNPWFDYEVFKDDYFRKLYGPASGPIRKFHDLLSADLCDRSKWLRNGFKIYPSIPEGDLAKMTAWIAEAEKAVASNSRALKAVQAQAYYLEYLKGHSKAMETADIYYHKPTETAYKAAVEAVHELQKTIKKLTPLRVVSLYTDRICTAWMRNLNASWQENRTFRDLTGKYNIIKELNPWKFKIDPNSRGDKEEWFAPNFDDSKWKTIKSGNFWEKQGFSGYDGTAWYRIKIRVPQSNRSPGLYFGGADERTWVYLDGKYVGGHHEGDVGKLWNDAFTIMLPKGTKAGEHQLTVKVIDSAGSGGLWKDVLLISKR